jgi:hypothetical protein
LPTDGDGFSTIPRVTWFRLLAPDSGLITQSEALRTALASLDGYTMTVELRALCPGAPDQDRRVMEGLALFLRHTAAKHRGDHQAAATTAAQATTTGMPPDDLRDIRRLGALVIGIARGRLPSDLHTEAAHLVHDKLGTAEAERLTALIRRGRRTPWESIRTWIRRRSRAGCDRIPGRSDMG